MLSYQNSNTIFRKVNRDTESDQKDKLYQAINLLSDIEKAIIVLHLEEHSYREIGEIIGISEGNAGVRISRIKNQLIKILENGKY
jgi:RNA polymerase sigma-70 factor (ECF subfamily)